jgi:hypothetical protein
MRNVRNAFRILARNHQGKRPLGNPGVDGRLIIKWIVDEAKGVNGKRLMTGGSRCGRREFGRGINTEAFHSITKTGNRTPDILATCAIMRCVRYH